MASMDEVDPAEQSSRRPGVVGLILGAVVLGLIALATLPAVVDWDTLGQSSIFALSAADAVLLGTRAARIRRDP